MPAYQIPFLGVLGTLVGDSQNSQNCVVRTCALTQSTNSADKTQAPALRDLREYRALIGGLEFLPVHAPVEHFQIQRIVREDRQPRNEVADPVVSAR